MIIYKNKKVIQIPANMLGGQNQIAIQTNGGASAQSITIPSNGLGNLFMVKNNSTKSKINTNLSNIYIYDAENNFFFHKINE